VDVEEEGEKWCYIWHHHYQQQQHATSAQKNERVKTMHVKNELLHGKSFDPTPSRSVATVLTASSAV
jgi:hypothetical protein